MGGPSQPVAASDGQNLAYPRPGKGGGTELVVLNVATGHERIYRGEARENIKCVTLADDLLAFASFEGVLYVASLRASEPPIRLRLPSSAVAGLTSDGHAVSLLVGVGTALVYSPITKKLTEHRFALQAIEGDGGATLVPNKMVLDYRRGRLDIFSCHTALSGPNNLISTLHVGHMRLEIVNSTSRTGLLKPVASSILQPTDTVEMPHHVIDRIQWIGIPGLYHLHVLSSNTNGSAMSTSAWALDASILFDARAPRLYQEDRLMCRDGTQCGSLDSQFLRWKDTYYSFVQSHIRIYTYVEDGTATLDDIERSQRSYAGVYNGETRLRPGVPKVKCQSWLEGHRAHGAAKYEHSGERLLATFVNDRCLVTLASLSPKKGTRPDHILVWWFDEHADVVGGRSTSLWVPGGGEGVPRLEGPDTRAYIEAKQQVTPLFFIHRSAYTHVLPYQEGRRTRCVEDFEP